jgi:hypothetical protein
LPGEEFLYRERIAAARFFKRKQAAAHGCDNFGLTADDPPFSAGRRQICDGQGATIRPNDILRPRSKGLGHE